MAEPQKTELSFQEKGDKVVMKRDIPNFEMDSREVLIQIDTVETSITNAEKKIEQMKGQIENGKKHIEENQKNLKKIKRFEEKMTDIQESKAKAIYEEVKERCRMEVEKEYVEDEGSTQDSHNHQKYVLYQRKIATCERSAKELAPKIMQKFYFKEKCIIENPFKGKTMVEELKDQIKV